MCPTRDLFVCYLFVCDTAQTTAALLDELENKYIKAAGHENGCHNSVGAGGGGHSTSSSISLQQVCGFFGEREGGGRSYWLLRVSQSLSCCWVAVCVAMPRLVLRTAVGHGPQACGGQQARGHIAFRLSWEKLLPRQPVTRVQNAWGVCNAQNQTTKDGMSLF